MKKRTLKLASIFLASSLFTNVALAGMPVTDPTSYTYYIQQLKEAQNQLKTMQDNLDVVTKSKETLLTMSSDITGAYNRAKGIVNDLKQVEGIISQTNRVFSDAKRLKDLADDPKAIFKEVDLNFDNIFVDMTDPEVNPYMVQRKKQAEVQKIFKDALRSSEIELAKLPSRMEAIEKLASQIDQTANIKDSQDLTNRLLTELIVGQERMISLLAQLAQAEVAAEYTGYSEEKDGAFRDRSHAKKTDSKPSKLKEFLTEDTPALDKPFSDLFN
jgi:hypothetical protein